MVKKRVSPRHPWALQMAPQGAAAPRLGTTGLNKCHEAITKKLFKDATRYLSHNSYV